MLRLIKTALACAALLVAPLGPAAAAPFPTTVDLPVDFSPEGIASGTGSTFYVGSLVDGDIYRGDLRTGDGAVLVDAPPGRMAGGLKVDAAHHRIFVAGGIYGAGYVYDTRTGAPLADFAFAPAFSAFINDVVVTKRAAYFTDSVNPVLYKVPIAPSGALGSVETLELSGPAATIAGDFNLNGIDATRNGKTLIVGHSALGALMTVDPSTGASRTVAITGGAITPGTPDGILLAGKTVWVVENFANRLVGVHLSSDLSQGRITSVITDDGFQIPTTVARFGSRLALVNARFDLGLPPPLGDKPPNGTEYTVVVVRAH